MLWGKKGGSFSIAFKEQENQKNEITYYSKIGQDSSNNSI